VLSAPLIFGKCSTKVTRSFNKQWCSMLRFRGLIFSNKVKGSLRTFGISSWKFILLILIIVEPISAAAVKSKPLRETVPLPVLFQPKGPGHYPCQITLKSTYDIRVYQLECTVCPEGSVLELEFITPTHQPVTQDIPVVNISYVRVVLCVIKTYPAQKKVQRTFYVSVVNDIKDKYFTTSLHRLTWQNQISRITVDSDKEYLGAPVTDQL